MRFEEKIVVPKSRAGFTLAVYFVKALIVLACSFIIVFQYHALVRSQFVFTDYLVLFALVFVGAFAVQGVLDFLEARFYGRVERSVRSLFYSGIILAFVLALGIVLLSRG